MGGRVRHVCVDQNALCIVEEMTGISLLDGVEKPGMRVIRALVYGALCSGARKNGGRKDFTPEDVGDWMEEEPALLEAVLELMPKAMPEAGEQDPPAVLEKPALQASA